MQTPTLPAMVRFALYAGLTDLQASLRRTGLGPLWSTLGLATAIGCLGLFFGTVLRQLMADPDTYIPRLAAGLIAWTFFANCLHQSCSLVWSFLGTLRHNRMTLIVPVIRVMIRNLVILGLNLAVAIIAARLYFGPLDIAILPLAAGLALLILNTLWMSYFAALACARFRDLPQLISWGIHLAFFLTPILWFEYFLSRFQYLLYFNPLAALVALVRQPLLGQSADLASWLSAIILACLGGLLCVALGRRAADRLPYWL